MTRDIEAVMNLFSDAKRNNTYVKVSAPMVRYSRVQFRTLLKNYGVDLCFTPMIMADSFCQNEKARLNEFLITTNDSPLIVQFAANNSDDFVDAAKLIYPYADGVDLNCGCPQKWAMKDGYGCALLSKPELIQDLVQGVRNSLDCSFSVSVKIRILNDLKKTVNMCQQLERCGVNFLTVHGRTPSQKSGDVINIYAMKTVCDSIQIPVIGNGGVKSLVDADTMYNEINCGGVMAASALLTNPALFIGFDRTPLSCVKLWMDMKNQNNDKITFQCYHHHLVFMLEKVLTKHQKQVFNRLNTFESVDKFLRRNLISDVNDTLAPKRNLGDFVHCEFDEEITLKHSIKCRSCSKSICYCKCTKYTPDASNGSYFSSFVSCIDSSDYMDSSIFDLPT